MMNIRLSASRSGAATPQNTPKHPTLKKSSQLRDRIETAPPGSAAQRHAPLRSTSSIWQNEPKSARNAWPGRRFTSEKSHGPSSRSRSIPPNGYLERIGNLFVLKCPPWPFDVSGGAWKGWRWREAKGSARGPLCPHDGRLGRAFGGA